MRRPRTLGVCQRTGFRVPADELRQEWTGLWVWKEYWEPKHPSYDQPAPRGERLRNNATGPDTDRHVSPGEITRDDL